MKSCGAFRMPGVVLVKLLSSMFRKNIPRRLTREPGMSVMPPAAPSPLERSRTIVRLTPPNSKHCATVSISQYESPAPGS